jgi:hypothetical protein
MPMNWTFWGLLGLTLAIFTGSLKPATAEFLCCNEALASYPGRPYEFAAQSRPRITIHPRYHPGPNSVRYCRSWLTKEYRLSGPVIVPQMRCWWD